MRYFLVVIALLVVTCPLPAQVGVTFSVNVASQPGWGPTGYDHVEYYYLPDIEAYYNVPLRRFYFNEGGRWIWRSQLPDRYRDYDFNNSYKVVVNEKEPFRHHATYRDQYSSYKGRHDQQMIRDSHDVKYFVNKNHPEHKNWIKQQRQDNGNEREKGRVNKHAGDNNRQDKRGEKKD
jgi:hypothetical protein